MDGKRKRNEVYTAVRYRIAEEKEDAVDTFRLWERL